MKKLKLAWIVGLILLGCGGAALNEACETPAGGGCESGLTCTNTNSGNVCKTTCTTDADCSNGENCNGISGSNTKSCQAR